MSENELLKDYTIKVCCIADATFIIPARTYEMAETFIREMIDKGDASFIRWVDNPVSWVIFPQDCKEIKG